MYIYRQAIHVHGRLHHINGKIIREKAGSALAEICGKLNTLLRQ